MYDVVDVRKWCSPEDYKNCAIELCWRTSGIRLVVEVGGKHVHHTF